MVTEVADRSYDKNRIKFYAKYVAVFFVLTFFYVVFGIFLFFYLEECLPEAQTNNKKTQIHRFCLKVSRRMNSKHYNNSIKNTTSLPHESVSSLDKCIAMLEGFIDNGQTHHFKPECKLDKAEIATWLEFVVATIHTIGYGNVVPNTRIGKIATIIYSLVGIPLVIILYTNIGNFIVSATHVFIKCTEKRLLRRRKVKHLNVKTFVVNLLLFLSTFAAAASVSVHNDLGNWTWLDSFYFWWITLTTIGYGDQAFDFFIYFENHPLLVLPVILFFLLGMALTAAMITTLLTIFLKRDNDKNNTNCSRLKKRDRYSSYNHVFGIQQSSDEEDKQYLWELIGSNHSNEIKQSTL